MVKSVSESIGTNCHVQHGSVLSTSVANSTTMSAKDLEGTKLMLISALPCSTILTLPVNDFPLKVQFSTLIPFFFAPSGLIPAENLIESIK